LSIAGVAKEFFVANGFTYLHGFGYDSVMNDHKLICLVCFDIQPELQDRFSDSLSSRLKSFSAIAEKFKTIPQHYSPRPPQVAK